MPSKNYLNYNLSTVSSIDNSDDIVAWKRRELKEYCHYKLPFRRVGKTAMNYDIQTKIKSRFCPPPPIINKSHYLLLVVVGNVFDILAL
jgi:hypothetical protein